MSCRGCGGMPNENLIALHVKSAIHEMIDDGKMCQWLKCGCGFIDELPEIPKIKTIGRGKEECLPEGETNCTFEGTKDYVDSEPLVLFKDMKDYVACQTPKINVVEQTDHCLFDGGKPYDDSMRLVTIDTLEDFFACKTPNISVVDKVEACALTGDKPYEPSMNLITSEVLEAYAACFTPEIKVAVKGQDCDFSGTTDYDPSKVLVTMDTLKAFFECNPQEPPAYTRAMFRVTDEGECLLSEGPTLTSADVVITHDVLKDYLDCAYPTVTYKVAELGSACDEVLTRNIIFDRDVLVTQDFLNDYLDCYNKGKYTKITNNDFVVTITYPDGTPPTTIDFNDLRNKVTRIQPDLVNKRIILSQVYGGDVIMDVADFFGIDLRVSNMVYDDATEEFVLTFNDPSITPIRTPFEKTIIASTRIDVDGVTVNYGVNNKLTAGKSVKHFGKVTSPAKPDGQYKLELYDGTPFYADPILGKADQITITGTGTSADPYKAVLPKFAPSSTSGDPAPNTLYVDGVTITGTGTKDNPLKANIPPTTPSPTEETCIPRKEMLYVGDFDKDGATSPHTSRELVLNADQSGLTIIVGNVFKEGMPAKAEIKMPDDPPLGTYFDLIYDHKLKPQLGFEFDHMGEPSNMVDVSFVENGEYKTETYTIRACSFVFTATGWVITCDPYQASFMIGG